MHCVLLESGEIYLSIYMAFVYNECVQKSFLTDFLKIQKDNILSQSSYYKMADKTFSSSLPPPLPPSSYSLSFLLFLLFLLLLLLFVILRLKLKLLRFLGRLSTT
jgi:hypothetical protein